MFFIIISALHVSGGYQRSTCSGGFSAHHQELIKLYVQPWVLSRFLDVYRRCGWVGTIGTVPTHPTSLHIQFKLPMMDEKTT